MTVLAMLTALLPTPVQREPDIALCSRSTKRIVRYNVTAGPACDRIGGISKDIIVPKGTGVRKRRYCIPAVTDRWQD